MSKLDTNRLCEYSYIDTIEGKIIRCDISSTIRVKIYTELEALQDDGSWKKEPRPDEYLCDKHFDQKYRHGKIIPSDGTWTFRRVEGRARI